MTFSYPVRDAGKPQILLLGNGLERGSGQYSWDNLLNELRHKNSPVTALIEHDKKQTREHDKILPRVPFSLRYELYCSDEKGSMPQSPEAELAEYNRFKDAVRKLTNQPNDLLRKVAALGADHIFTTNYSYCIENSICASGRLLEPHSKSRLKHLLYLTSVQQKRYRLNTCYYFDDGDAPTPVGVWHIHGETAVPDSIVLGHDGYGRILGKITGECTRSGDAFDKNASEHTFTSWPELFLFGDIYILGFSFHLSEFDLWWLLKRKQKEQRANGQVYFYEQSPAGGFDETLDPRLLLLQANGVTLLDAGVQKGAASYEVFYESAMTDIQARIAASRKKG